MALLFTLYEIFKSTKYLGPHLSFHIGQAALRLAWEAIAPDQVDHGEDEGSIVMRVMMMMTTWALVREYFLRLQFVTHSVQKSIVTFHPFGMTI